VKEFLKSVEISESYCQKFGGFLFWNMCTSTKCQNGKQRVYPTYRCLQHRHLSPGASLSSVYNARPAPSEISSSSLGE